MVVEYSTQIFRHLYVIQIINFVRSYDLDGVGHA